MLPYCQQFCNLFSASSPPAWQGSRVDERHRRGCPLRLAVAWRAVGLTGPPRIRQSVQAGRTSARRSVPHPHVTCTSPQMQHSATCIWWPPRSVCLFNHHASTRRHPPHVLTIAAAYLGAPDCSGAIFPEPTGVVRSVWRVPTGEAPRTYGRGTSYLRERHLVPTGEAPSSNLLFLK